MNIDPLLFLLGVVTVLNLGIGIYVLKQDPDSPAHQSFALLAVSTTLWTAGVIAGNYIGPLSLFFKRVTFAAGSLLPVAVLACAVTFPVGSKPYPRRLLMTFAPLALFFLMLSFSPWIVASVEAARGEFRIKYGWLHPAFAGYVVACLLCAASILARKHRSAVGLQRLQARHFAIALLVPGISICITNVLVPLVFKVSSLAKYGPLFSLIVFALVGHAIIRHRLMDIRVVIKQGVVYLASFTVAGGILLLLLVGSNFLVPDENWFTAFEMVLALVVAVLFYPLKTRIQLAFDRYLYREPYDYPRIIRETSQALNGTIDLSVLLACVGGVILETFKPERLAVYLLEDDGIDFERAWMGGDPKLPGILATASPLVVGASTEQILIFRDEQLGQERKGTIASEMDRLGVDVVAPLVEEGRLFGLVAVGPKRSGNPYFSNDADLLQTLAHQSAIAIRNAQTHQRVVQVNEELQKTLATIENGVVVVGARRRITVFNKAAETLTGLTAAGTCGQGIEQLPPVLARLLEAALERHESQSEVEIALPDAAGQLVPLMCTTSLLRNPQGGVVGAVAVFSDLSRLKELERERRRTERLASIEAIASGMVHEIRNPLVAIKTFTQLLPSRFSDAGFRESFSRVAGHEIARIDELLEHFRTLASASRQPMEPVDITVPIRNTLDLLQPQLDARGIRLRWVGDASPRRVLGNASQLEQLFLNLCLNALEAMDADGELTVRVADLSEGGGSTLLVEVSDTGSGISEELLERVFNPFVTTKSKGTGLGLAICRAIADAHRAVLRARNNAGRPGCTFTIEFPVPAATRPRVPA
jgi:PAS domain S-box-containing protein